MKRILFLVNGYGLGNSTRIHGIIQHIDKNCEIDIFADGNSLSYFKRVPRIQNIFHGFSTEYGLKNGKIDFLATAGKTFKNCQAIYKSRNRIKNIIKSRHYDLIVSDSSYSPVFLKNRPKLISINNADVIIKKALKIKKEVYIQFFMEFADYVYNLCVPDLVISPFFEPHPDTKNIRHIPVIVRKEFQDPHQQLFTKHHVLIMTGGAISLNQGVSIKHSHEDYDLSVLGGGGPDTNFRTNKKRKKDL